MFMSMTTQQNNALKKTAVYQHDLYRDKRVRSIGADSSLIIKSYLV